MSTTATPLADDPDISIHSTQRSWPGAARAWYALSILMVIVLLAILDRSVISLLVEPIKKDLRISDIQMSLLMGFAFVTFYMIVGVPIARLADRYSRRVIIAFGLTVWSVMTALCGLSSSAWQLYGSRMGVGIGEACNGPATYSLLADYFPKHKLAKAMSVLTIGFYVGAALANIAGSRVLKFATSHPLTTLPILGALHPWQLTFIAVGLPGLVVLPLLATMREPARRGFPNGAPALSRGKAFASAGEMFHFFMRNRATYIPIYVGLALRLMITIGFVAWLPAFFERTYGWKSQDSALAIGLVQLTFAPLGLIVGGVFADWLDRRGYDDANMRVNLISTLLIIPTSILFPLMPTREAALVLFGLGSFFAALGVGPFNAAVQIITPNAMRAQFSAVCLLLFNLVGSGLSPYFVALVTDRVFANEHDLRYSLAINAAVFCPASCILLWYSLRHYRHAVAGARNWT